MSAIDTQNAKQIRDPMDVLITLDLADDTVTCTFSDYGSAKVGDGKLNVPNWPMRKLADLQGEGFPLNGEHVLYDPSTTPSQANGKLGVRSNVGQSVSVTVTGNKVMASLTLFATGAESVTFNGTTTPYTGSSIVIPVGATSITLTFNPANDTERIVISDIQPGTLFRITNENLIKATVSLRSDLSIIDPTLPESEINIEVYQDTDISEAVANIPEDTPITYRAGYPGDMSPERKFYVTGQVTWADNVLTIQGVDAVHFLDTPQEMLGFEGWGYLTDSNTTLSDLYYAVDSALKNSGISAYSRNYVSFYRGENDEITRARSISAAGRTFRDFIAQLMQLIHIDNIPEAYFSSTMKGSYWLTYVDAGRPTLTGTVKPGPKWTIDEGDCGNINKAVNPTVSTIVVNNVDTAAGGVIGEHSAALESHLEVGTIEWLKGQGAFVKLDEGAYRIAYGLGRDDGVTPVFESEYVLPILPANSRGSVEEIAPNLGSGYGLLFTNETQQKFYETRNATIYTQVVPWSCYYGNNMEYRWRSQASAWAGLVAQGIIAPDAETFQLKVFGNRAILSENQTVYKSGKTGITAEIQTGWIGRIAFCTSSWTPAVENALPDYGYRSLFDKSPVTASFTWKGDPRIQPRDVFTWHRLDGTDEEWTFENITLTHEGGGTLAEITARKGIV